MVKYQRYVYLLQRNSADSAECNNTNLLKLLTLSMGIKEILQGLRVCTDFTQVVDKN